MLLDLSSMSEVPISIPGPTFFVCVSFHLTTILRLSGSSWEFEKFLSSAQQLPRSSSSSDGAQVSNNTVSPQKLPD